MLHDLLIPKDREAERKDRLRDLNRERHFEALYVQSFTEMRARSAKR